MTTSRSLGLSKQSPGDLSRALVQLQVKDSFQSVFDVARFVLLSPPEKSNLNTLHEVKASIDSLGGDTQLWNDGLFENYLSVSRYYDDKFEKTAFFTDTLSRTYVLTNFIGRTQSFSLSSHLFIPSAAFKLFCA